MGFGQLTYVPDNWFEAYLENNGMGNGIQYDDSVFTASIDTVTYLDLSYGAGQAIGIFDLTGIEDFTNLEYLDCSYNLLTSLDVSNNSNLLYLFCQNNQLTNLNVSNNPALHHLYCFGNLLTSLDVSSSPCFNWQEPAFNALGGWNNPATDNPNLFCVQVDNVICWNNTFKWSIDTTYQYYSNNCSATEIEEHTTNKELLKTIDILGREVNEKRNTPLFYIYNDGTVEKKIIIE